MRRHANYFHTVGPGRKSSRRISGRGSGRWSGSSKCKEILIGIASKLT